MHCLLRYWHRSTNTLNNRDNVRKVTTPGMKCPGSLSPSSLMGLLQAAASSFFRVAMWALCDLISSSKCVTRDKACCLSISSSEIRSNACCWHSINDVTTCWNQEIRNSRKFPTTKLIIKREVYYGARTIGPYKPAIFRDFLGVYTIISIE